MNYSLSLKQKVNFYVSVAFILAFGSFMTVTIVSAINRDSKDLKYMSVSTELSEVGQ